MCAFREKVSAILPVFQPCLLDPEYMASGNASTHPTSKLSKSTPMIGLKTVQPISTNSATDSSLPVFTEPPCTWSINVPTNCDELSEDSSSFQISIMNSTHGIWHPSTNLTRSLIVQPKITIQEVKKKIHQLLGHPPDEQLFVS